MFFFVLRFISVFRYLPENDWLHIFFVHDHACWWVKASNLWGSKSPVVRFNLEHVSYICLFCWIFLVNPRYCYEHDCLLFCGHDPAWWWVKASNLGGRRRAVVGLNLAHVMYVWFVVNFKSIVDVSWTSVLADFLCAWSSFVVG